MRILAIGAGYVGLATAIGFARQGHEVRLVDLDQARLRLLRDGTLPFEDLSLTAGLANCLGSGLTISDWDGTPGDGEVAFICVNTPPAESGALDVSRVHECAAQAANLTAGEALIAIRSTVNPGTALAVERELRGAWPDIAVVSNPEFLREGMALYDFDRPDRRVVGGHSRRALNLMRELYSFSDAPLHVLDQAGAELIKLASNAALATRVSLANEIAALALAHGADAERVLEGVGADARLGQDYFRAGLGFGGNCLPKDLDALRASAPDGGSLLLDATVAINERAIEAVASAVVETLPQGGRACIVGVGFKRGSDSVRGSRALLLAERLLERGLPVAILDPIAGASARQELATRVDYLDSVDDLRRGDVVVLAHGPAELASSADDGLVVLDALGRRVAHAQLAPAPLRRSA